jgi:hypothetical protein
MKGYWEAGFDFQKVSYSHTRRCFLRLGLRTDTAYFLLSCSTQQLKPAMHGNPFWSGEARLGQWSGDSPILLSQEILTQCPSRPLEEASPVLRV